MIFMTTQKSGNWESKWILDCFSCRTSTKLELDLNSGTSHTISVYVFLKTSAEHPSAIGVVCESHEIQNTKGLCSLHPASAREGGGEVKCFRLCPKPGGMHMQSAVYIFTYVLKELKNKLNDALGVLFVMKTRALKDER